MMSPDEIIKVTRAVFNQADIASSSDFIITAYELNKRINPELMLKIDPVYFWEYKNWHDNWVDNVNFIDKKLKGLDPTDYEEIISSYTAIIEYFLDNEALSKLFLLNEKDNIGWKIFKELDEKRLLAKKYLLLCSFIKVENA